MADNESFESLYQALEERARKLEDGGLSLEESVATYEEGADIAGRLREMLQQAEARIRRLDVKLQTDEWVLREDSAEYDDDPMFDGGPDDSDD